MVEIHTDGKDQAAPTYKGGFGFHPMFCFADATGETLSGILRPGNAGANTVADHITILDGAIAQLPEAIAVGHRVGDGTRDKLRSFRDDMYSRGIPRPPGTVFALPPTTRRRPRRDALSFSP